MINIDFRSVIKGVIMKTEKFINIMTEIHSRTLYVSVV